MRSRRSALGGISAAESVEGYFVKGRGYRFDEVLRMTSGCSTQLPVQNVSMRIDLLPSEPGDHENFGEELSWMVWEEGAGRA
jgi:hypothetical protein